MDLRRIEVTAAATVECDAGWSWASRPETFAHHNLWVVHRGAGEMRLGDRRPVPLGRGRAFVLRPRTRCRASHEPADPLTVTYVHFHPLDARGRRLKGPAAGLPPVTKRIASADLFEACCRRVSRLDTLPGGRDEAAAYVTAMLVGLRAEPDAPPEPDTPRAAVLRAAALARERPAQIRSVADLAAKAGYGPDHLAELFRRHLDTTPARFLIAARIARAKHLLRHGTLPVADVARVAGYSRASYFARQFRREVGLTPGAYRDAG
jgi:AraC-like DNA-binding protein